MYEDNSLDYLKNTIDELREVLNASIINYGSQQLNDEIIKLSEQLDTYIVKYMHMQQRLSVWKNETV